MIGATLDLTSPQIVPLTLGEDVERALISLVGDIAAYRPGKKVVIFEGGGDSEFDVQFTTRLFPDLGRQANVISSGNKLRVRELHDVLEAASAKRVIPFKVYSITDQDSDTKETVSSPRFKWNVYHIENYLLETKYITLALKELGEPGASSSNDVIYDLLRMAASNSMNSLIRHEIGNLVNAKMRATLHLGYDPNRVDIGMAIHEAVVRSAKGVNELRTADLDAKSLIALEIKLRKKFEKALATDSWRKTFRGRDILKEFARVNCKASYEILRNVIISRMADDGYKPTGMRKVVDEILKV